MLSRRALALSFLAGCSAYAEPTPQLRPFLPKNAKLLSQHSIELNGAAPKELAVVYRYTKDGEEHEALAFYAEGCDIFWRSDDKLSTLSAPTFEVKELTGDSTAEVFVYQPVHADQELWIHLYQMSGCSLSEVVDEFTRPAAPPKLQSNASGTSLSFTYEGSDGCETTEDPGYIKTYSLTQKGLVLLEARPALRLYPLFTPNMSGGALLEKVSAAFGELVVYDHLAVDLTGDGKDELVLLHEQDGVGALLVATQTKDGQLTALLRAAIEVGPLALDGPVKALEHFDLTGDGVSELLVDSSASQGCQLESWVLSFSQNKPQLLLQTRRSLKEKVALQTKKLSYKDSERGLPATWTWNGKTFVGPAKEIFHPKPLP